MQDRFIRLSVSLARLQKVIQRIKTSGMGRIALKAGHTLVLCQLAAAPEGWHLSDLTERKCCIHIPGKHNLHHQQYNAVLSLPRFCGLRIECGQNQQNCIRDSEGI